MAKQRGRSRPATDAEIVALYSQDGDHNLPAVTPEVAAKMQRQKLRQDSVETRHSFTAAATSKGADGQGIAESTNWIYWIFFGNKPQGDRKDWAVEEQQGTMMAEHLATNRINELPTPPEGSSQRDANNKVIEATKDGAHAAKDLMTDKDAPGAWEFVWSFLNPPTIWEDGAKEAAENAEKNQ